MLGSGASGRNAAILRTFSCDQVLDPIARRGAAFLRRPPAGFAQVPLVDPTGSLLAASGERAARWRAALPAPGGREVTRDEARRLAPHLSEAALAAELHLWFEHDGRIDVAALIEALAAGARSSGIELRTGCSAARLLVERGRVVGVELVDGSRISAATTVLAAGAWAGTLGRSAGSRVALRPTRRHLLVTAPDPALDTRLPIVWLEDEGFYARPESGGMLLCACDEDDVDPDRCESDPAMRERIAGKTTRLLALEGDPGAAHFWHGLRTLTPDGRFVVGPDPDLGGLVWVAGLGGHGMTCGVEVGRLAARAVRRAQRSSNVNQSAFVKRSGPKMPST